VGPTFQDFGLWDFATSKPNIDTWQLLNFEGETKVGPTLWGFGVRDFATSEVKHQYTATPEILKVKRRGNNTSGFWGSGFHHLKIHTSISVNL
jgi:hypothetical protein